MADVNEVIGGYRLRTLLQTSQKTQVFEVVEPVSNRHFAMKLLLPEAADDPVERAMLFHEAEVGIEMRHENVVHIIKVNKSQTTPHFIMEYFPSGSLRERLKKKDSSFIKQHSRKIFKQMATGLAYMNANGYIHRDVKPDNVLVNPLGETKLIDFAITKKYPTGIRLWFYRRGKPQGTPSYMSPEQIRDEVLDTRADIYSYGCTLYEVTTGRPPFRATTTNELLTKHLTEKPAPPLSYNPDITDAFSNFILKLIAKDKKQRPKNFHEVLMELKKIPIYRSVVEKRNEYDEY